MATKNWTDERTAQLENLVTAGEEVSQELLEEAAVALDVTKRSAGAKLRKLGYVVELASNAARSKWSDEEEAGLRELLSLSNNQLTYAEIAASFENGKHSAKTVQGKILSMELTSLVKPTPKLEVQRTYTPAEEATFTEMAAADASIEAIAEALGKSINSVRGKALSMSRQIEGFKIPTQAVSHAKDKVDALAALGDKVTSMTVAEIAVSTGKTDRGIKTTLTRRGISCADYDGAKKAAKAAKVADKA